MPRHAREYRKVECKECLNDFQTLNKRAQFCCSKCRWAWNNKHGRNPHPMKEELMQAHEKIKDLKTALGVAAALLKEIRESLPDMPDPAAVIEEECAEVSISWKQWTQINMFLSYAEQEDQDRRN